METIKITPIGTCRIHTPFKRALSQHSFKLALDRNYGYVHTSSEVLQQLDFILGNEPVPRKLWPLIYRKSIKINSLPSPSSSDLYFLEISSSKHVTIDDIPIQLNYVNHYFNNFFSNKITAKKFWAYASSDNKYEQYTWLENTIEFNNLTQHDRDILKSIRVRKLTPDEIRRDIVKIIDRVGAKKAIFITHVNGIAPNGSSIESREKLINLIKNTCNENGVRCYDPTHDMNEFGQIYAMEKNGLDLTHFTPEFADLLAENWFIKYIHPLKVNYTQTLTPLIKITQSASSIENLKSLFSNGEIIDASRKIRTAISNKEAHADHYRLLSKICFTMGDYEQSISITELNINHDRYQEEDYSLLMQAHFAHGDYLQALHLGKLLLSQKHETHKILEICAIAAEKNSLYYDSIFYWNRLFELGLHSETVIENIFNLLFRINDYNKIINFADNILASNPDHLQSIKAKWNTYILLKDNCNLSKISNSAKNIDPEVVFHLAQSAWICGLKKPAIQMIAPYAKQENSQKKITDWIKKISKICYKSGLEALNKGDLEKFINSLSSYIILRLNENSTLKAKRILTKVLQNEFRNASKNLNLSRITELRNITIKHNVISNELNKVIGESYLKCANYSAALSYFQEEFNRDSTFSFKIKSARTAVKAKEYSQALYFYHEIAIDKKFSKYERSKATESIDKIFSATIRNIREEISAGNLDQAWELLKLLSMHSSRFEKITQEKNKFLKKIAEKLDTLDKKERENLTTLASKITIDQNNDGNLRLYDETSGS